MKILGFTDERTSCDCCGKTGLKGTYVMDDQQGNIFHYGSVCGANAANCSTKELKRKVKLINDINEVDTVLPTLVGEKGRLKLYYQAIKKGYSKDDFFKKHGVVIDNEAYYTSYQFECLIHNVYK